jgi:membrane-bound metal-dependent hydrolase YbcI (DUF457 family)
MRIVMAGSHVVVGIATWTLVAPHLGLPALDPVALGLATFGSLLPDIDHPRHQRQVNHRSPHASIAMPAG